MRHDKPMVPVRILTELAYCPQLGETPQLFGMDNVDVTTLALEPDGAAAFRCRVEEPGIPVTCRVNRSRIGSSGLSDCTHSTCR